MQSLGSPAKETLFVKDIANRFSLYVSLNRDQLIFPAAHLVLRAQCIHRIFAYRAAGRRGPKSRNDLANENNADGNARPDYLFRVGIRLP